MSAVAPKCQYDLGQWLSNFSMPQNHLEGLFKHKSRDPSPRVSDSVGGANNFQASLMLLDHTLRTAALVSNSGPIPASQRNDLCCENCKARHFKNRPQRTVSRAAELQLIHSRIGLGAHWKSRFSFEFSQWLGVGKFLCCCFF